DKNLIANRGEIACRVIDTTRALGVRTVAVYSDADRGARHVMMADEAVHIGGSQPAESYLRGDVIINAARATGAQAVHPGYGFLSENPDFVEAVEAAGLVFVGPSAPAIRSMGLKDAAKALMEEAGVPVVPGYHGADQADARLAGEAAQIGYPVLIKAVAGGGGKGMRLVERAEDFASALASARSEAQTAFGNADVLIEKFVNAPRHIEVQVFGDGTRAVHLYERDCSLQRRHQKVIEEAPAPGMTGEMREAMGAAAVRAAEAIGYAGAGTVEFIVDGSEGLRPDGFWFMEMNTRLQVEHPVTEAVTGVDLVEWQLRVASGEGLPMVQDEIPLRGHAFEARLYAEDVPAGFLPATGRLAHLAFAEGCRADTGVRTGDEISPFYDPMIAKVITHGATRDIALGKMRQALARTQVAGTVTNIGFLSALCAHAGFAAGEVDTGLIGRDLEALTPAVAPSAVAVAMAALGAAGLLTPAPMADFTLWTPMARAVMLGIGGEVLSPKIEVLSPREVRVIGEAVVTLTHGPTGWRTGTGPAPDVVVTEGLVTVFEGAGFGFDVLDPLDVAAAAGEGGDVVEAPMPGLVKAVHVAPGDAVEAGMPVAVMEAMKMEHTLVAPRDGVVGEVLVSVGSQVEAGAALIALAMEAAA
ncbi:MAG TPA: 3-methylcrotonyl-CoA carboxylase, partial [Maritimibacter sp.]|nr:3-methylcrotonyl-CoA carboxylase [Maritimibacter sp.]